MTEINIIFMTNKNEIICANNPSDEVRQVHSVYYSAYTADKILRQLLSKESNYDYFCESDQIHDHELMKKA